MMAMAMQAQVIRVDVKVTDVEGTAVKLVAVTSSSATGCASPDFPVLVDGIKEQRLFEDYKYITVMPYEPSSNDDLYVTVELENLKGVTEMLEMSKYLRVSGSVDGGRKSFTLKDISMIEVFLVEE